MKIRFYAFLIHLTGSVIMGLLAMALVFLIWYPSPLHKATGVTAIFFIVMGVDVIIGPVLTFLVFKPGKKSLRFDLMTIIALQLVAFGYGIWTVAEGRPAWIVFNVDRFDLTRVTEIDNRHIAETRPEYQNAHWFGPEWVSARIPTDIEKRNTLTLESALAGIDLPQRPDLYLPLEAEADTIRNKAHPLDKLSNYNSLEAVQGLRLKWPDADSWLPMMASVKPLTVLLRKDTAKVIAVVDLNPWN